MNSLLLQSSPRTSISHHHQPHHRRCNPRVKLLDDVTNSFIGVDEWIEQEFHRIVNNLLPRNCPDNEALLAVIEAYSQTEQYFFSSESWPTSADNNNKMLHSHCNKRPAPSSSSIVTSEYLSESMSSEEEGKEEKVSHRKIKHQQQQLSSAANSTTSKVAATIDVAYLTKKNLILAFSKLIHYCQHESSEYYLSKRHRIPLELLIELEKMREMSCVASYYPEHHNLVRYSVSSINQFQERLAHILFGETIPILGSLVGAWTIICLWAQQGQQRQERKEGDEEQVKQSWMAFGILSYDTAKEICGSDRKSVSLPLS